MQAVRVCSKQRPAQHVGQACPTLREHSERPLPHCSRTTVSRTLLAVLALLLACVHGTHSPQGAGRYAFKLHRKQGTASGSSFRLATASPHAQRPACLVHHHWDSRGISLRWLYDSQAPSRPFLTVAAACSLLPDTLCAAASMQSMLSPKPVPSMADPGCPARVAPQHIASPHTRPPAEATLPLIII